MSTLLLKINFNNRNELSPEILAKICKDMCLIIDNKKLFNNTEKIFMNYQIKPKKQSKK